MNSKDLKELQQEFKQGWDEIKSILDAQQDEIRTLSDVLEQLIGQ